jgi:hypothetical protein
VILKKVLIRPSSSRVSEPIWANSANDVTTLTLKRAMLIGAARLP